MAADINIRIGAKLDGLQRSIKKAQRDLSSFADFAENVGTSLTTRLTVPILGLGTAAVKTFAEFDRIEKGLASLTGSAEAGAAQFNRLNEIVLDTRTTLDLKTAALGAQRLLGAGKSAEFAENTIKQLGIAATVSGSSIDDVGGVIRQFTQILGKGKVEQEDLNSILDRMPAIGEVIQQEFGGRTAEAIRATGISMDEFVGRTISAIENSDKFQSVQGGLAKAFESFFNAIQVGIKPLGEAIAKSINLEENLKRLGDFVANVSKRFAELPPDLQKFIVLSAGAAAAVGPLVLGVGALSKVALGLSAGLKTIGGAASVLLAPLGGLAKTAFSLVSRFKAFLGFGIEAKMLAITRVTKALFAAFNPLVLIIGALSAGFTAAFTKSETFRGILSRIVGQIQGIAIGVFRTFTNTLGGLSGVGTKVTGALAGVVSVIGNLISAALSFVGGFAKAVKRIATGDLQGAWDAIKDGANEAFSITPIEDFQKVYNEVVNGVSSFKVPEPEVTPTASPVTSNNVDTAADLTETAKAAEEVAINYERIARVTPNLAPQGLTNINGEFVRSLESVGAAARVNATNLTGYTSFIGQYLSRIELAAEKNRVFGDSQAFLSEKINITRQALEQAVEQFGANSVEVEELKSRYTALNEELANVEEQQNRIGLFTGIISSIGDEVESLAERGKLSFKSFANAALSAISDVIGGLIKQGVAAAVANALKNPAGIIPPVGIALAAAAGAGASALFKGLINTIKPPGLAGGGIIPPGFEGDRFPAFLNSGEAVIPLDRLFRELNGGGGQIQGIVRGQDLLLMMERAASNRSRLTGV